LSDPATAPDFVALSFYKIFGFPNIGALIVRKDSAHVLQDRKYFGGGTVEMVVTINDTWHAKKDASVHDRLEDGTLPFHSIFALDHAMNVHERLYGPNPMKFISHHTAQLGKMLYDGLSGLRHANGAPVCHIYKDDNAVYGDPSVQGATIAFNVHHADGSLVGFEDVEEAADDRNIFVRSGSLCNPGGVATYLNWSPAEMKAAFSAGHRCTHPIQIMLGKPTGVVRVSLGAMSTASDVRTLIRFLDEVYAGNANMARLTGASVLGGLAPLSPPASPGPPAHLPALETSKLQSAGGHMSLSNPTPSTAASLSPPDMPWDQKMSGSFQPQSAPTPSFLSESEKPKYPPFVPSDYVRKPWEAQMHKQPFSNVGMEIKVREMEDASVMSRNNATPSVKSARKFGRSVVNLLRTKSHVNDAR
jgi:molybdenum cofactor sulfurtransferase